MPTRICAGRSPRADDSREGEGCRCASIMMRAGHLESTLLSGCSHRTACGASPLAHPRMRTPTCGTPACTHHAAQRSRAAVPTTTPRARSVRRTAQLRTHVLGRRAARRGVEVLDGHACRATSGRALDCGALAFLGTSYWGDDAMRAEWQPNQLRAMAIHDTRPPVPSADSLGIEMGRD